MDRPTDAEFDVFGGELVDDVFRVPQRPGEPIEFGNDESVAVRARGECFAESSSGAVGAGEAMVGVGQVGAHAEVFECVLVGGEILFVIIHAGQV